MTGSLCGSSPTGMVPWTAPSPSILLFFSADATQQSERSYIISVPQACVHELPPDRGEGMVVTSDVQVSKIELLCTVSLVPLPLELQRHISSYLLINKVHSAQVQGEGVREQSHDQMNHSRYLLCDSLRSSSLRSYLSIID